MSVYLNGLLIASKSIEEHVRHASDVLVRLKEALKPSKCVFATGEIEYLGHTSTSEGVWPNNKKVTAVNYFPVPKK